MNTQPYPNLSPNLSPNANPAPNWAPQAPADATEDVETAGHPPAPPALHDTNSPGKPSPPLPPLEAQMQRAHSTQTAAATDADVASVDDTEAKSVSEPLPPSTEGLRLGLRLGLTRRA